MKQLRRIVPILCLLLLLSACTRSGGAEETPAVEEPKTTEVLPTEKPSISEEDAFSKAEDVVKGMTLEQKIGQMLLVDLLQLDDSPSLDGTAYEATDLMKETIQEYYIGGVYLTQENVKSREQTEELTKELQSSSVSGSSLYIAVEEDGGGENSLSAHVDDLKDTGYVTPQEMGESMTAQQIRESGKTIAGELTDMGINLNLAPVADIGSETNPVYAMRCMGTDADTVAAHLKEFVTGMRMGGLGVTLSSFPGNGNVAGDVSEAIMENTDSLMSLRENNFVPYSSGIDAGADCVMVSNVSFTRLTGKKVPAFMSYDIVTKLLREELKFDGIIMTSPMNDNVIKNNYTYAYAAVEAVKAGCDMIVLPENFKECYEALIAAVNDGRIDEKVINTSVRRILQNKIQRGILVFE